MLPNSLKEVSCTHTHTQTDTHTLVFPGHINFMSVLLTKTISMKENYKPLLDTLISVLS